MTPEIIEPQFDLAAQEARELARRATLAPSDVKGPEPVASTMEEPEAVTAPDPEAPQAP